MRAVILALVLVGLSPTATMAEEVGGRDWDLPAAMAAPARSGPSARAVPPPRPSGKPESSSAVAKERPLRNPLPSEDDDDDTPELSLPLLPGSAAKLRLGSRDSDPFSGSTTRRPATIRPSIVASDRDAAAARHVRAGLGRGTDTDLRLGLSFDIP